MKQSVKRILSLLLVAATLAVFIVLPAGTIHSTAATTYQSNQTLVYDIENLNGRYGILGISNFVEFLSSLSFFEFYSGDQCIASNVTFNDFPYYSSYCITKVVYNVNTTAGTPSFNGDLEIDYDITVNNSSNAIASFDIFIRDLDAQTRLYTFTKEIPISAYNGLVQTGPVFPAGYDFDEDSYRFTNYSDTVSKKYFTTLYGSDKGKLLYKNKKKQGGLCFGFSYTTASIYNDLPSCSVISTYDKGLFSYKFCDNIRDIWNLSVDFLDFTTHTTNITSSAFVVGNQTITIEDYIKYAQIYQYSNNVNNGSVWCNDANDILELVKDYTDANRIGVTIGMTHDSAGGHRVLAVGYDGNDILVDDPNYKNNYQRITVNADGSWSFSGLSNWNSNTCDIRYNLDYHRPYQLLLTGRTTTVAEKWIDDNINVSEHYIEGMDILNKDSCLIAVNADGYTIENENLTKIISEELAETENEDSSDMYWLANDKTVTIEDFNGEDSLIEFSGNGKILSLETDADGSVTFDVENANVNIQTKEKEEYLLAIEDCYQDEAFNDIGVIVAVSGTASGDAITATQTETGLLVTGISDGVVTLSKDDKVIATQTISDAISDIEITYDKTGEDENIEVDYEQPENPSDPEVPAEPDIPTEPTAPEESTDDNTDCSCMCHSKNSFMQLIYTIIRFFWQLFGINMDCACGAKHFDSYFFG